MNILLRLRERSEEDPVKKMVLDQYKPEKGETQRFFIQNTVVDWDNSRIHHYPMQQHYDFKKAINLNAPRSLPREFSVHDFTEQPFDISLTQANTRRFLESLTGISPIADLHHLPHYFGLPSKLFLPRKKEGLTAVLIGCSYEDFFIDVGVSLESAVGRYRPIQIIS